MVLFNDSVITKKTTEHIFIEYQPFGMDIN